MTKEPKTRQELEEMILAELHANPVFAGVERVTIRHIEESDKSWEAHTVSAGDAEPGAARAAVARVSIRLQEHYDLVE